IGQDALIHPGSILTGHTKIGAEAIIGPHSEIHNCEIGSHSTIKQSVVQDSQVGERVDVGQYAHIRPDSAIADDIKIGNFVEIKKSTIGNGSKVSHLRYIGDTGMCIDESVGCGTITVIYDGNH